ncbi:MAG: PAS domain-containing protein [Vicinamibacteria bacterium]|nr:PAS domain-containing protein [Vicinamibacteria bacterium]MCL4821433.1 PAS domain-containing protein [Vicinamibacteria bacterium]
MRAVLAAALLSSAVSAEAPPRGLAQFGLERWTLESGLPANWVTSITQTADGFLWAATSRGLVRFDGRSFRRYSVAEAPELPTNSITALWPGREGRLWLGLEHGGVASLEAGELRLVPRIGAAFAPARVNDLVEDSAGVLWIATSQGLWRASPDAIAEVRPAGLAAATEVMRIVLTSSGDLWARSTEQGLWRVHDGVATQAVDAPDCRGYGLAADASGPLATTCRDTGVFRWDSARARWDRVSAERAAGPVLVDRDGAIWFSGRAGLHRWSGGAVDVLAPDAGLGDWRLRAFFQDGFGDFWFGTFNGGLARLRAGPIRAFGAPEGLAVFGPAAILAGPGDELWLGSYREGLVRWSERDGVLGRWRAAEGLPGDTAWALARDPRRPEGLWVGSDRGLAWLENGRLRAVGPGGLRYGEAVQVLYVDPAAADTLWVAGGADGAWELAPDRAVRHDAANGLEAGRVLLFHRTRSGGFVAGGHGGVFEWTGSRWARWPATDEPLTGARAVVEEADGTLWLAAHPAGLVRRGPEGDLSIFGPRQGIPFGTAYSLILTPGGDLWISSEQGLFRMRLDDHARWRRGETATVPFERFGRRDGLRDGECNGWGRPAVARLSSGALAYPTQTGVALVDPSVPGGDDLTPARIYVDAAWAGARLLPPGPRLVLERHERSLRIAFSAIEWQGPESVRFRYRIEGLDVDWVPAGLAGEASYSRLPPGDYHFRLQARLPGRPWVEALQPLAVSVEPTLWEIPGVRVAAACFVLGLVALAGLWRARVRERHAAALARERAFLWDVIDISPNPIFARSPAGSYVLANRATAEVYGLRPADLEGRTPAEMAAVAGMAAVEALDEVVIAGRQEQRIPELKIVDHAGRERWFRVVKRPRFTADGGAVEQVVGTAVEITDFKQAALEASRLSLQLLRAQEDERRRLGRELHDDLVQRLAGLAMLAWSRSRSAESRDAGSFEEVARELESLSRDVQALSRDLHPAALDALGLAEALRAECATFARRTGFAIDFHCRGPEQRPALEVALAAYRIAQEALRNVLNHSGANAATVTLEFGIGDLRLEVADAGRGFDPAAMVGGPGVGLGSMAERARLAGGELAIDSGAGGTRVRVRLPLEPAAP